MNKIIKHHLEEEAIRLRSQGFGYIGISNQIKEKHGIELSFMSVKRFLDSNNEIISEVTAKKEEYKEKLARFHWDIIDGIVATQMALDNLIEKHEDDWRAHATFLRMKLSIINLLFKLEDNMKPQHKFQKIDMTAIKDSINKEMMSLLKGSKVKGGKLIVSNPALIEYYTKMKPTGE